MSARTLSAEELTRVVRSLKSRAGTVEAGVRIASRLVSPSGGEYLTFAARRVGSTVEVALLSKDGSRMVRYAQEGLYGLPACVRKPVEAAIRKCTKYVSGVARRAWERDADVVGFLKAHEARSSSGAARVILDAMRDVGPKVASARTAVKQDGPYGYKMRTSRIGLDACTDVRLFIGGVGADLSRRVDGPRFASFLEQHAAATGCCYSSLLLASFPDAPEVKTASLGDGVVLEWVG